MNRMKGFALLLSLILCLPAFHGCQKEIYFPGADVVPANNTPSGWSFTSTNTSYKGCFDTAFYQINGGVKTVILNGSDSAFNQLTISIVSQTGSFSTTTYTPANGAMLTLVMANGTVFTSATAASFSVQITAMNDTVIMADFNAALSDGSGGPVFSVSNGKLKALIGRTNHCAAAGSNPVNPGTAVFTLESSLGTCDAIIQGSYIKDSTLKPSNKVLVDVLVSSPGTWSIHTPTLNGIKFFGSGSFSTTGTATIKLQGIGTPFQRTLTTFPLSSGSSNCSFDVMADTISVASCTPAFNTVEFISGAGSDIILNSTHATVTANAYKIAGNGPNGDIVLEFAGTSQPQAGTHTIQPVSGSFGFHDVRVSIVSSNILWQSNSGQVYVYVLNGRVSATLCNVPFSGSLGGTTYTAVVSARVGE